MENTMKANYNLWIFAGETSGDVYGANLAKSLKETNTNIKISGMGGNAMKSEGVDILVDSTELGVVGIVEVLKNIFKFIKIFKGLVKEAVKQRPDAVILIDYPGFNLRFAKQMHNHNIPVIWYVSPQIWVWGKKRIHKLNKYCNKMLVIFPFEVDVYKNTKLDAEFVGHPLVDIVKAKLDPNIKRDLNKILLLPGSRHSEVTRVFSPMLETAKILHERNPNLKFKISAARPTLKLIIDRILDEFYKKYPNSDLRFEIGCGNNLALLQECGTGLSKSGTITVEAAIAGIPLVVFNILNPLTFLLARIIVKKLFRNSFTMPNIIANKTIYEEFLQKEATPESLAIAVEKILPNGERRTMVENEIKNLSENMLTFGKTEASKNTAAAVLKTIDALSAN